MSPSSFAHRTRWKVNPYSWAVADRLARELALPPAAAMVLAGRGFVQPADARRFIAGEADIPDPFLFEHMERAVAAISAAIDKGQKVVIHGDYDADGITATALMLLGLRQLGLEAGWYLPSRFKEGYGLSRMAVDTISAGGASLLITVDCGVNYPDEVALAKERGLEVVVVDHHQPGPVLPDCHLIHAAAGRYPHGDLCGVGLAFKVLHALYIRRCGAVANEVPKELSGLLDLVAVGTVADLAALVGENRYYVREGLKLVAIGQRVGFRALANVSGCTGSTDSSTVAYRLAPRLNAAGRLADPSPPLRLLLSQDEKEAMALAQELHELNGARQDVERQIAEQAVRRVDAGGDPPPVIVLAGEEWHEGVVGIVAARLVERYHRPAILLGVREGVAKGSGRSIGCYDIMGGLNACADHLTVYGGHPQAVGLTLEAEKVDDFRAAIVSHASHLIDPRDLVPTFRGDAVLRGEDIDADTAVALASFGPFGSGNPRPRLLLAGADILQPEATRDGSHLRCSVRLDGVRARAIGFGLGKTVTELQTASDPRVLGVQLQVDSWQGSLRPEFQIEHVGEPLSGPPAETAGGALCGPSCPLWPSSNGHGAVHSPGGATPSDGGSRGPVPAALALRPVRDLRDHPGRLSALAQVLATAEPALIIGCSLPHLMAEVRQRLPLDDLCAAGFACVGSGCGVAQSDAGSAGVVFADWDSVAADPLSAAGRIHVVAMDPPYTRTHVGFLERVAGEGAGVHLYYGPEQRESTARLLRYVKHPRFAMVCAYRAREALSPSDSGSSAQQVCARAAHLAWEEAGVVLHPDAYRQALETLALLGTDQARPGEAKLDAREVPAYVQAEADYEESSRLCHNL